MGHLLKVYVQQIELAHCARLGIVVARWFAVKTPVVTAAVRSVGISTPRLHDKGLIRYPTFIGREGGAFGLAAG